MSGVADRAGKHLLKVCEGILAGVYSLTLDDEKHKQLLADLRRDDPEAFRGGAQAAKP